jgi:hypothetical protein
MIKFFMKRLGLGVLLLSLTSPAAAQLDSTARGLAVQALNKASEPLTPTKIETAGALPRAISVPLGLGWNQTNYPIAPTVTLPLGGQRVGSAGYDPFTSPAYLAAVNGPQYYVSSTGNNTNNCLTAATACASITYVVGLANAGAVPATINIYKSNSSGILGRVASQWTTSAKPTVDLVVRSVNGRSILGVFDSAVWTTNATYSNVSQTTRSSVLRVVDPARIDRFGLYTEYGKVTSLLACSQTPGTWYTDGTTLYVNPFAGESAADQTIRTYLNVPLWTYTPTVSATPLVNLFIDGLDFEGGSDSNFLIGVTASAAVPQKTLAIRNSSFRYGGGGLTGSGAVYINGWSGLVYIANSDASAGWSDLLNFHNTIPTFASMYVITVNCSGSDAGRGGFNIVSNNAWTAHDSGLVGIDIAGIYQGARGRTFHIVGTSKALAVGTVARDSIGDIGNGGAYQPAEFAAGDGTTGIAELWLDSVDARPSSSAGVTLIADGAGIVRTRNLPVMRGSAVTTGTATIVPY